MFIFLYALHAFAGSFQDLPFDVQQLCFECLDKDALDEASRQCRFFRQCVKVCREKRRRLAIEQITAYPNFFDATIEARPNMTLSDVYALLDVLEPGARVFLGPGLFPSLYLTKPVALFGTLENGKHRTMLQDVIIVPEGASKISYLLHGLQCYGGDRKALSIRASGEHLSAPKVIVDNCLFEADAACTVEIVRAQVRMRNCRVQAVGSQDAVRLLGAGVLLDGCEVSGGLCGVYIMGLDRAPGFAELKKCVITGNKIGVLVEGASAEISDCILRNKDDDFLSRRAASGKVACIIGRKAVSFTFSQSSYSHIKFHGFPEFKTFVSLYFPQYKQLLYSRPASLFLFGTAILMSYQVFR